jgi:hypothetical protein
VLGTDLGRALLVIPETELPHLRFERGRTLAQ